MLGAITGDVIGSVYEFNNTKDYNFPLFKEESIFTDDSVMTMAVAMWLLHDPTHSYEGLEEIMLDLGLQNPHPYGGYGTGFWTWLFQPDNLRPYNGPKLYESEEGRHPYGSWGNGSAMRVSAVGWAFDSLEETETVAKISAEITHNHPEGIKGAQATAAAIFLARQGKNKKEIKDYVQNRFGYDLERGYEEVKERYGWQDSCQKTVPEAIIAFLESKDFEDAIRLAVSLGGDSDTLACITGGIAEAFYGGVPEKIKAEVLSRVTDELRNKLDYFAKKFNYKY